MKKKLPILLTTLALTATSHAVVLSSWTFETNTPADITDNVTGPVVASEAGAVSGSASGVHATATTDWTTPSGNGSANSLSSNTWTVSDYYQFTTSTIGYTDITISFDQVSSATGPGSFALQYSTDGTSFTQFASYTVLANSSPNAWSTSTAITTTTYTYDLSSIDALEEQSVIYFRLVQLSTTSANGSTVATGGTSRVDNVVISAVPEPGISLISAIGFIGLLRRRR